MVEMGAITLEIPESQLVDGVQQMIDELLHEIDSGA